MNQFIYFYFPILFITIIISSIIYYSSTIHLQNSSVKGISYFSNENFFWPLPGFNRITSYFGPRRAPTSGASSTHSGIDIAAPEGTIIYSVLSCKIVSTKFSGAGRLYHCYRKQ